MFYMHYFLPIIFHPMSNSSRKQIRDLEFVLKAIRETSIQKREAFLSKLFEKAPTKPTVQTFSSLENYQKGILRKKCIEKLSGLQKKKTTWSGILHKATQGVYKMICLTGKLNTASKTIHPGFFDLINEVKKRCLEDAGVFRREGNREAYRGVVNSILNEEKIDFAKYEIHVLGSALKSYIRDYHDGIFDETLMNTVINEIKRGNKQGVEHIYKYMIFAASPLQRRCLVEIQDLMLTISKNKNITKMNWESLSNILCLTVTPQNVFTSVDVIPILAQFFNTLMKIDMEDISDVKYLLA